MRILRKYNGGTISVIWVYYEFTMRIQLDVSWSTMKTLWGFYEGIIRVIWIYYEVSMRVSLEYYEGTVKVLSGKIWVLFG